MSLLFFCFASDSKCNWTSKNLLKSDYLPKRDIVGSSKYLHASSFTNNCRNDFFLQREILLHMTR